MNRFSLILVNRCKIYVYIYVICKYIILRKYLNNLLNPLTGLLIVNLLHAFAVGEYFIQNGDKDIINNERHTSVSD